MFGRAASAGVEHLTLRLDEVAVHAKTGRRSDEGQWHDEDGHDGPPPAAQTPCARIRSDDIRGLLGGEFLNHGSTTTVAIQKEAAHVHADHRGSGGPGGCSGNASQGGRRRERSRPGRWPRVDLRREPSDPALHHIPDGRPESGALKHGAESGAKVRVVHQTPNAVNVQIYGTDGTTLIKSLPTNAWADVEFDSGAKA